MKTQKMGFWSWLWHGLKYRLNLIHPPNLKKWFANYENEKLIGFLIAVFSVFPWLPFIIWITFWALAGLASTVIFGILLFLHAEYRSQGDY